MRFFIFAATCMLTLIGFVHGQSVYAFDRSCQNHPKYSDLQRAFGEAVKMAEVSRSRLADPQDQTTELLFNTIFKRTRAQETRPYNIFSTISRLLKSSMALGSTPTIMIFCDNDERWVEKYDERRKQNLWFNPGVERFLPPQKKPSCKTLTRCNAVTYNTKRGHHTPRSEITMCDRVLDVEYATMAQLVALAPGGNVASPGEYGITEYAVISRTALHELTHAWPSQQWEIVDKGYKWRKVFPMVHEEAIINADSYAYFGEISFLTGHKLSEVPAERQAGVIVQV